MESEQKNSQTRRTPPWVVVISWLIVGIPLGWGVSKTLMNSMALFK